MNSAGKNRSTANYNTLIEFAKFLRQNGEFLHALVVWVFDRVLIFDLKLGDKLFEKDAKLSLKSDQLLILQDYFQQLLPDVSACDTASSGTGCAKSELNGKTPTTKRRTNSIGTTSTNKEFLLLYKSNQLHIIQDFLFKITNLKVTMFTISGGEVSLN